MNALINRPASDLPDAGQRLPEPLLAPIKRWRLTLACLMVSAVAAAGVAAMYGQKLWLVEGTVVYTPLPIGDAGRGDYTPPSPQTMISLIKSPQRLERVVADLGLPTTGRVLDRSLKVNQQPNVDAVRLSLEWPDPHAGRAIVDRLVELYVQDMAEFRRRKVDESTGLLQAERAGHLRRAEAARAAYAALPGGATGPQLVAEAQRLTTASAALTADLNAARERLAAIERETARLRAQEKADAPPEDDAAYRERRTALAGTIREYQDRLAEIEAESEAKKKELVVQQKLVEAGTASPAEHAKITGELKLLSVRQRNTADALAAAQKESAELPGKYARIALVALAIEKEPLEQKAAALARVLADNGRELSRVGGLIGLEQEAAKRVEQAEAECQAAAARVAGLERLRAGGVTEFAAAHSAAAGTQPAGSNRKSLAVLTFGGLVAVYLFGVVGLAWYARPRPDVVPTYGLPVLAVARDGDRAAAEEVLEGRRLALALRDPVRASGGLILIAPAGETAGCDDVARHLARYLALTGEAVLILDARVHQPRRSNARPAAGSGAGLTTRPRCLSRYLRHQPDEPPHVQESETGGVWYLPAGDPFPDADLLASDAMRRLLVQLSERYDRVLILCPPLDTSLGAEILAGYADGAVVAVRRGEGESPAAACAVDAIRAAGVPWAGALVLPRNPDDLPFADEELPTGRSAQEFAGEEGDVPGVTRPQPAGFGGNPPRPLEAAALDPVGGPAHPAR
jgi:Mrp family chromosome partitioning ATPase